MSRELKEIFDNAPQRRTERRKGLDRRGKIGLALSIAGWTFWGAGLYLSYFAYPQTVTYFDVLYNKSPNQSWEPMYFLISGGLWIAGAALCLLSLFQFRKRYRRRTDKRHIGILTALIFNVVTLVAFGIFTLFMGII
ncbi:MAG: hypothetical protein FWH01_10975 [Oscillospiraceae bacterium]|nr:hypothetical protein [Oscillospiraceae bacterium]